MKRIAKTLSVIFNPLVIAPFAFYILIFKEYNPNNYLLFLIAIFFSSILPFSSILYFKKIGKISSLEAPIRKQRLELLVISSLYNSIAFVLLNYFDAPDIVQGLMFCYAINTFITWLITRYWKISIHMIGLGGPFVALIISGYNNIFLLAIIIILVYLSRIKLKAHNHAQLIAGTFLAIALAYVELKYLFL
tara:strand:+ start:1651 stop:2223 length:573 start_codon:yes stop_codon:yes gene_type:complete